MADPLHSINRNDSELGLAPLLSNDAPADAEDDFYMEHGGSATSARRLSASQQPLSSSLSRSSLSFRRQRQRRATSAGDDGGFVTALDEPINVNVDLKGSGGGGGDDDEHDNTSLSFKQASAKDGGEVKDLYESLDYDPQENFIYQNSLAGKTVAMFARETVLKWLVVLLIGFATALFALAIDAGVTYISEFKYSLTRNIIAKCGDCFILPLFTYIFSNMLMIAVAAWLVCFLEPVAGGSGIPEIKCYLNGIHVPRIVRLRTLLCKTVGIVFSVASGLPCGKEGPMIHTGAILAAGISQGQSESVKVCRFPFFRSFRNDNDKRDFVSSGAAAGVAAAFGAPVGGVLFALEEGSSFWNQALTWRTFACATFCSFTLNVLASGLLLHSWGNLSTPGLATFGSFSEQGNPGYTLIMIPFFILLGVAGGLLGALFIAANHRLTLLRRKVIKSPWSRMLEALIVSVVVSTAAFSLSYFARDCVPIVPMCAQPIFGNATEAPSDYVSAAAAAAAAAQRPVNIGLFGNALFGYASSSSKRDSGRGGGGGGFGGFGPRSSFVHAIPASTGAADGSSSSASVPTNCIEQVEPNQFDYFCEPGEYNAMARIFFTTSEKAIRNLFHSEGVIKLSTLAIFFVVYYALACLTYGIGVPSGLFVPAILSGCALGRLVGHAVQLLLPAYEIDAGVFALMGGAAMLGGIARMTISLTVIIIESTNDITYGLPIMMTLMVAKWVGDYFNEGIYDLHIHLKGAPFLEWEPPVVMRKFKAMHVMSKPVVCFHVLERVSRIVEVLRSCRHNGFPVVDQETRFVGIVLRSQLLTLLRNRCFKRDTGIMLARKELFDRDYPRAPDVEHTPVSDADMMEWIDLAPYINLPYTIRDRSPLARVFRLFRTMGLRHLVVVDVGQCVVGIITRKDLTHLEARLIEQRRARRSLAARNSSMSGEGQSLGTGGSGLLRSFSGLLRSSDSAASAQSLLRDGGEEVESGREDDDDPERVRQRD
jgi:chloride channel 7